MYVQYPDLSEIQVSQVDYVEKNPQYASKHYPDYTQPNFGVRTEFVFGNVGQSWRYLKKVCTAPGETTLKKHGFKLVSMMLNWWPSHNGDRVLKLYWWKNPQGVADVHTCRTNYGGTNYHGRGYQARYNLLATQGTGCGMKIGTLPLSSYMWFRYFTIMRLPKKDRLQPIQIAWLKARHFRFLDEGSIASYWVNGWKPREFSPEVELAFWKKHDPNRRFYVKNADGSDPGYGHDPNLDGDEFDPYDDEEETVED